MMAELLNLNKINRVRLSTKLEELTRPCDSLAEFIAWHRD